MLGKFILRVLVFLSIPTVILGGWGAFIITLDYRSYVSSLPVPSDKDIVICGDSQSKDRLDPTCFPRLHNYSHNEAFLLLDSGLVVFFQVDFGVRNPF
jgi:hypothetical protein